ncbi:MAG: protein kinase [Acidobacteriia bacterium]|nr:protein kinase [Terriglobia bacterium]
MNEGSQPASAGQTVNGYQILGMLGAGGMGMVYKALDIKLKRTVALKFLPPESNASEAARALFLEEARAASALDHPNIGTIHGIEEDPEGRLFIVMAYYEGQTLSHKMNGPMPPSVAVPIAIQIAHGLAAAHARNIVHRDIKPSNVVLTAQGLVKIVDFGLARVISSANSTRTLATAGTASYMSPEQVLGEKGIDRRTDLWSLGVVLHQMLTGDLAFEGDSVAAMLFAIVHAPPREIPKDVAPELQRIVYRALAKDREQRYQSAEEMAADLEAAAPARTDNRPTMSDRELASYREKASVSALGPIAQPRRGPAKWVFGLLAVAVVMGLSLLVPAVRQRVAPGMFTPPIRHIAVLPIDTIGSNPNDATLADGLMESLTSRLSNLEVGNESLWVVPASEVRRRKVTDPGAALKTFGANLVVAGTLQRDPDKVRLILNLIDAKSMRQLGSGEFEDRAGDFSAVQDSAVAKLANLMKIPLTRDMLRNTGGSVVPAAYELYLKGLGLIQRYDKPGNLDQAISALNDATRTDPKFAIAFAGLGEAYLLKFKTSQDQHMLDEASANCNRALQLNDQLAAVHVTIGRINDAGGKHDVALQEFQRALALEPHNADALIGIARVYETEGRAKDAEEMFRKAAALRPDYWDGYNTLGLFFYRQKRYPEAIAQFQHVSELTPDNVAGYLNAAAALIESNRLPEAADALGKALKISPSYGIYANLGQVYFRQGKYAEAAQNTEAALKLNNKDYRLWVNLAGQYRWLNDDARAVEAYRQALQMVEEVAKLRPQDAGVQVQLGQLYAYLQQKQKAVTRVETALALAPDDPDVLENAAVIYQALGDHARGIQYAIKALDKGYDLEFMKQDPEARALLADPELQRVISRGPHQQP